MGTGRTKDSPRSRPPGVTSRAVRTHIPETGWTYRPGHNTRLACFVEGEGPLVVMIHGFPDTPHTWDATRARFVREGYRVATPFLRGYAPSPPAPDGDYRVEAIGRDIAAFAASFGEKAILIGHDWGAFSSWAAVELAPECFSRFVCVAIPPPGSIRATPRTVWASRHMIGLTFPGAEGRFAERDFQGVRTLYERWSPEHKWTEAELDAVKNCFAAPGSLEAALAYYRQHSPLMPAWLTRKVVVPTLVVAGESDGITDPVDFEKARDWVRAPCEVVMVPGGHFVQAEHPEAFCAAVLSWLRRPVAAERAKA